MTKSGIYKITNAINGKFYIGSSFNTRIRFQHHNACLRKGTHHNKHLQSAWNKYGGNFSFEQIASCPQQYLLKLEQWFIDNLKPEYNIKQEAAVYTGVGNWGPMGLQWSEVSKEKARIRMRTIVSSPDYKPYAAKVLLQIDIEGSVVKEWESRAQASRNGYSMSGLGRVLRGESKTHKGFVWRYK